MAVLSANEIVKTFQEGREQVQVLRGVSLELHAGEVVALEGPSRSGKTTLLSILDCILTSTRGELTVDGIRIDPARPSLLPAVRRSSRRGRRRAPGHRRWPPAGGGGTRRMSCLPALEVP